MKLIYIFLCVLVMWIFNDIKWEKLYVNEGLYLDFRFILGEDLLRNLGEMYIFKNGDIVREKI